MNLSEVSSVNLTGVRTRLFRRRHRLHCRGNTHVEGMKMITETGHNHSTRDVCRRDDCPAWPDVQRAKRRVLRKARRRLFRTRLACLLTGGHKWLRMHEGDGSLAFIDCRKCGLRP